MATATKTEEWNGMVKGDVVKVTALRGKWRFTAAWMSNEDGSCVWVQVNNGNGSRSVTPDRVTRVKKQPEPR